MDSQHVLAIDYGYFEGQKLVYVASAQAGLDAILQGQFPCANGVKLFKEVKIGVIESEE